jgi:putative methionine-R-sulfoxide reductase with GAF domain
VNEPNLFGNPEFLKDPKLVDDQSATRELTWNSGESQMRSATPKPADEVVVDDAAVESRLSELLAQVRLAVGATGAAIALISGEKIVCHATTGSHVPDIGVSLDPHNGLSGSCIQTRHLQQCNDTEMDPRVDSAACRALGVRSIVVLPLMDGNELFGIIEILSSRPNAFGQRDLDILEILADRIIEGRRQNSNSATLVEAKDTGSLGQTEEEVVLQDQSQRSESGSGLTTRQRISRRRDLWTPILVTLVIGTAVLLGALLGFRFGWQESNLGLRSSPPTHRVNVAFKTASPAHVVSAAGELQPISASVDECDQPIVAGASTVPPRGGLTICQQGRVIFRLPHSALSPIRGLQTSQSSPGLEGDLTRDSQAH